MERNKVCMANYCKMEETEEAIAEFVARQKAENVEWKYTQDAYSHFSNWFRIQLEKKRKKKMSEPRKINSLLPTRTKNSLDMLPRESKGQMPSVQQESKEVSIYTGELTPKCIAVEMKKLGGVAFPDLDPEFLNVLTERVVENGFTNERLQDAVGELIDTFQYKRPSVANIINYDKRMRLYSHSEGSPCYSQSRSGRI